MAHECDDLYIYISSERKPRGGSLMEAPRRSYNGASQSHRCVPTWLSPHTHVVGGDITRVRVDLGSHEGDHVDNTLTQSESSPNKKCNHSMANTVVTNGLHRGASNQKKKKKKKETINNTRATQTLISKYVMGRVKGQNKKKEGRQIYSNSASTGPRGMLTVQFLSVAKKATHGPTIYRTRSQLAPQTSSSSSRILRHGLEGAGNRLYSSKVCGPYVVACFN